MKRFLTLIALLLCSACWPGPLTGVQNRGGYVMKHPTVHMTFWGSYWQSYPAEVAIYGQRWDTLLNTPGGVLDRLSEYGVTGGTFDTVTPVMPSFLADNQSELEIINEINLEIAQGDLPTPSADTIYVIMLPPGWVTTFSHVFNGVGYHLSATYDSTLYTYAIVTYGGDSTSATGDIIVSHEIYEATTNPTGSGWVDYVGKGSGEELADLCEGHFTMINNIAVAQVWSAKAGACL
jgi:hypothetical protein